MLAVLTRKVLVVKFICVSSSQQKTIQGKKYVFSVGTPSPFMVEVRRQVVYDTYLKTIWMRHPSNQKVHDRDDRSENLAVVRKEKTGMLSILCAVANENVLSFNITECLAYRNNAIRVTK